MNDDLGLFGRTARELSRGPLGIIALFLVLVYAVAALVVGAGSFGTKAEMLAPLVWFLAVFPVLVLAAFTYLVARYPEHLYPPSATPLHWPRLDTPALPSGGRKSRRRGKLPPGSVAPAPEPSGRKKKRAPPIRPKKFAPSASLEPEEKPHDPDRG